jgi:hypothetical protein
VFGTTTEARDASRQAEHYPDRRRGRWDERNELVYPTSKYRQTATVKPTAIDANRYFQTLLTLRATGNRLKQPSQYTADATALVKHFGHRFVMGRSCQC